MLRLAFVLVSLVVFGSCKEDNSKFCENPANNNDPDCRDGGVDASIDAPDAGDTECTAENNTCSGGTPVCNTDPTPHVCVVCSATSHALCTGTTPACRDNACAACTNNSECGDGGLCLPDGSCAAADSIMYASPTGAGATCDTATPCSLSAALTVLPTTTKTVLKLASGTYQPDVLAANFAVAVNVTIDARDATLHGRSGSPVLKIEDGKTVRILGGTIEGANAADGVVCGNGSNLTIEDAIIQSNERSGISVLDGCSLTATRLTLTGNGAREASASAISSNGTAVTLSQSILHDNRGGGISIKMGTFVIVGNVFMKNGTTNTTNATVAISTGPSAVNRLEFNTIANNQRQTNAVAGVDCLAGDGFTATNNIIWNNTGPTQFERPCLHTYSVVGPASAPPQGTGNSKDDPKLTGDTDPHLQAQSSALGTANPSADISGIALRDIDGNTRASPADIGADYVSPRPMPAAR